MLWTKTKIIKQFKNKVWIFEYNYSGFEIMDERMLSIRRLRIKIDDCD